MRKVDSRPVNSFVRRRKSRHKIIIASGDNVRTIVIRPWMTVTLGAVGFLFFSFYLAATGYLVFRDDLLAASISRQAQIRHAYEDRIASLRADIDRLTSRQLLNQQAFEEKLGKLLGRQAALDARQDIIAGLSQAARRAGLMPADALVPTPTPNPLGEPETATGGPLITGSIDPLTEGSRAPLALAKLKSTTQDDAIVAPPAHRIAEVEDSLETLAHEQIAYVETVANGVVERADQIMAVLDKLGHPVRSSETETDGIGGPFVALAPDVDPETFRDNVSRITADIERLAAAKQRANQLPLSKPIVNAAISSRYGSRVDPFLGRPALHTGIDFRSPKGFPVRATAAGTVVTSEYTGGYGKMVEIDHGNGVTTRYGHMNRLLVKAGDKITKGTVVGRVGSTGRSTGPHLHYEVRVDGNPIDPMRYIRAGGEIAPLL
jgi:murein DD-endopeptidase MepM/ murein hydrolase activator NlpD